MATPPEESEKTTPFLLRDQTIAILLILLILPTNLYLLAWRTKNVIVGHDQIYLDTADLRAMAWLEANTAPSDIVLAPLHVGQYVPGESGNVVYLGHWAQTVDFREKRDIVGYFFGQQATSADRERILDETRSNYLFEPATGSDALDTGICEELGLPIQYSQDKATICEIPTAPVEGK
jgi:hypothetical protein